MPLSCLDWLLYWTGIGVGWSGGSMAVGSGFFTPSWSTLSLFLSLLISTCCSSISFELSAGSIFPRPLVGAGALSLDRVSCSSTPLLRESFKVVSMLCACVRITASSLRRSLISFSKETFSWNHQKWVKDQIMVSLDVGKPLVSLLIGLMLWKLPTA